MYQRGTGSRTVDERRGTFQFRASAWTAWLNRTGWVEWFDEPVPGYPTRPIPRREDAAKALKKRTLTNLYNARPQRLVDAHDGP